MKAQVSPGGIVAYRYGQWGLVHVNFVNPTDEPMEMLAVTFFDQDPSLQYGRRVWIPPKSRWQSWHPLRLPPAASDSGQRLAFRTLLMDPRQEREVLIRGDSGSLQVNGLLRVTLDAPLTGLIERRDKPRTAGMLFPDEDADSVEELLIAARLRAQRTRLLTDVLEPLLSAGEEGLQVLDQLVIADSRVAADGAGLTAIRRWLFGGGHLWVMLDRADPRVLERLLGDEFVGEVVDRVGLTTVSLQGRQATEQVGVAQEHDQPVEFVRIAVSGVDVEYTIDGWPAAFWKTCGEGRLLVTTLGARGWTRRRTAADNQSVPGAPRELAALLDGRADPRATSKFAVLEAMSNLAPDFFMPSPPRLLPASVLEPLTHEYVGYAIPSRGLVSGLLLGFSVLLVGLGTWLWRRNRLELLGTLGPIFAVAISVVLVSLGRYQRTVVPPMVASVQILQAIPGTDDVRIEGTAGLFSAEAGTATIHARQGGWLLPEETGLQGTTRRMVWTDLDEWHWENLPETAGIRNATFLTAAEYTDRLEAHATFGPEGLTGRLHVPGGHRPSDPILATRDGRFGVDLRGDGTFVARADHVFSAEQFLAAGLLSDEQDRRRRMLEQLLANPLRLDFPAVPQLLFWTEPWDVGFRFDESRRLLGAALLAVPLKLYRPPTGTEVMIASPLLPYRAIVSPDGMEPSGWWDAQHHQWIEKTSPSETWLRFQIPAVLLPIAIEQGRVRVQVRGPVGKLELAGLRPDGATIVPLKTWIDPVGTLSLDITDTELLSLSDDGGLRLRVAAGVPSRPEPTPIKPIKSGEDTRADYWQIESLTLELKVKTAAPPNSTSESVAEAGKDAE